MIVKRESAAGQVPDDEKRSHAKADMRVNPEEDTPHEVLMIYASHRSIRDSP